MSICTTVALLVAGCGNTSTPEPVPPPAAPQTTSVTRAPNADPGTDPGRAPVAPLPRLTLRQLAGQRVIYSYKGATPPASLLEAIRRGEAAGVIFFAGNVRSRAKLRAAVAKIKKANSESPVKAPLLLMTDQEGGPVRRLPGAPFQSARQMGASANPAATAAKAGRDTAANLRGVGLNVNLAPVLDVYRKKGDFADRFGRSFSKDPKKVAALASAFLKAQQKGGVAATVKHFPGLGPAPTKANTDLRKVVLKTPAAVLRSVDESPYGPAIAAGAPMVMLSWAVYPALDKTRPAGLSQKIISGELRGRVGFKGVTITDALEAGALKKFGSVATRGLLAAGAGMDLLLFSAQNPAAGLSGVTVLAKALQEGKLDKKRTESAVRRILTVRRAY
ncbi:hypothetical protein GCM10010468_50590 [Actinocorallia longicatena]|uniref:Glycoside hydrolase family 3 N-terminal domain-containing protein n=1 Tax=Actinocorallia longicatena TaxID=111803 RepID=A0ABP6QEB2_9ACTN